MTDTLKYYNEIANDYFDSTVNADMSDCRKRFLKYIQSGAYILDAGCGSGRDSKYFIDNGFKVKAIDGSEEMCRLASEYLGQPVDCVRFEDFKDTSEFDAIWACASLLHVDKDIIGKVMENLHASLKDQGILYASFKYGDSDRVQEARYFNDMNESRVKELFRQFDILELWFSDDVRPYRTDRWTNVIAKKSEQ